jgi:hypothetical protein
MRSPGERRKRQVFIAASVAFGRSGKLASDDRL